MSSDSTGGEATRTARKQRRRAERESRHGNQDGERLRELPNWPLLAMALAGVALTGYLSYSHWADGALLYCTQGSACALVQSSRWSTLLGVPTAFWGFLTYCALAIIAATVKAPVRHWRSSWILATVGISVSIYLTAVSVFIIKATCAYCLASFALVTAIFTLVAWQKPQQLVQLKWDAWLLRSASMAVVIITVLHLHYSGVFHSTAGPEDPRLRALAEHLSDTGAKFYGASWCPHCQQQKQEFTASVGRLPYVECSPGGRQGPRATDCVNAKITSYPTWIINGRRHERLLSPQALARYSRFDWNAANP